MYEMFHIHTFSPIGWNCLFIKKRWLVIDGDISTFRERTSSRASFSGLQ